MQQDHEAYFVDAFSAAKRPGSDRNDAVALQLAVALFKIPVSTREQYYLHGIPFEETYRHGPRILWEHQPWKLEESWVFDSTSSDIFEKIIRACGLDPTTCTHDELEEVDPYVVCPTCDEAQKDRATTKKVTPILNWSAVVSVELSAFISRTSLF